MGLRLRKYIELTVHTRAKSDIYDRLVLLLVL